MVAEEKSVLPGEFAMIEEIFAPLAASAPGALGLKDDAASCALTPGQEMVVTADALVEGVHFLRDDLPALIARKALRANLSDLAAKGAAPEGYLITISIAPWVDADWLKDFAAGLSVDQKEFGIALIGGDTTATPGPLTLSITALGSVPRGSMLRRGGAGLGDLVFVTGTIGDAGAGLAIMQADGDDLPEADRNYLVRRYLLPEPRLFFGGLLKGLATSSLDVSDGLVADLGHIASASGVGLSIEATQIPLSSALVKYSGTREKAVLSAASSGEDYEIAFTAPSSLRQPLEAAASEVGVTITEIGRVEAGAGVRLLDESGQALKLEKSGFTHF